MLTPFNKSTALESPPKFELPQVTTEPTVLRAAKARLLEKISITPMDKSPDTLLESPPWFELPQVTTEPSVLIAPKAKA